MSHLRSSRLTALLLSTVLGLALVASAAGLASTAQAGPAPAALADPVASSPAGAMTADITGTTADEDAVTGTFTPLKFTKKNGKVFVRGVVDGVITDTDSQTTRTFTVIRTTRVLSMNGTPAKARTSDTRTAMAECEVLDLVLAPLRLDLLGLVVNLDRVDLNITAVSGPGNLLGNLLCTVVGLLDGGLQGLLGRVVRLLNRILGQLGLGL